VTIVAASQRSATPSTGSDVADGEGSAKEPRD
jgi:hypothetical protein